MMAGGVWTSAQCNHNIIYVELPAIFLALRHFGPVLKRHVLASTTCHLKLALGLQAPSHATSDKGNSKHRTTEDTAVKDKE